MSDSITSSSAVRQPVLPDIGRKVQAKANARYPDIDWQLQVGQALQRAIKRTGLTNQEAAAKAVVDDAEFGKWMNGTRRPHLDKLFAVRDFQQPIVIELARLSSAIEIVTELRLKESA